MADVADFLMNAGAVVLLVCLVLVPLFAVPRRTRRVAGIIYVVASVYFGLCVWLLSAATVYHYWGGFAVVLGVFIFGVGVLPMALIIDVWHASWSSLAILLSWLVPLALTRFGGGYLMASAEKARKSPEWK